MPTTVDKNRFAMVPRADVPRSAFDVNFVHKTTFQAGLLIPIYIDEVLPGDSLSLRMNAFGRLATPIVPVMDNVYLETFFFFIPNRLVWANWEAFMGEEFNPNFATQYLMPQVPIADTDVVAGTLGNYFGLVDPVVGQTYNVNALPFRCYNKVWNDWFRDQDLQNSAPDNAGNGPDVLTDYTLRFRCRRPDYYTTCRPAPQKLIAAASYQGYTGGVLAPGHDAQAWTMGDPTYGVGVPVSGIGVAAQTVTGAAQGAYETGGRVVTYPRYYSDAGADIRLRATPSGGEYPEVRVLINDFRTAYMIQRYAEKNLRGGTRYAEWVRAHFGVVSPDARLQRPEYLGGGRSMVNVSPVAQTSETSGTNFLGEQAGVASVVASNHGFSASFTEHGWILGLVNVRTDVAWMRGVNRMWFRRTAFDHYAPEFAHLGEQAVLSREVWVDGNTGDESVFGYNERWAEYRWKPGIITGQFQSWSSGTPLTMWHFAPDFTARPLLNDAFIQDDPPMDRVLQVAAFLNQEVLLDTSFKLRWVRCMPMFSIPGLGDGRF